MIASNLPHYEGFEMPGKSVKNWDMYEKLRGKGYSKSSAARITNSKKKRKK